MKAKHLKMKALSKNILLYHKACSPTESEKENTSASKPKTANDATSFVFANRSKEELIYPLTVLEIAYQQRTSPALLIFFKRGASSSES